MKTPDLSHRLTDSLGDSVSTISIRATSVLSLIQEQVLNQSDEGLNYEIIFFALESVRFDIADLSAIAMAACENQQGGI